MKIYIFYTKSHKVFLDDWFLPSIKDDFDIRNKEYEQVCKTAKLNEKGWNETMCYKIDTILRGIEETIDDKDNIFIHSDIDIQFFGKIEETVRNLMKDNDVLFQKGGRSICMGFMVVRANEKTKKFFTKVRQMLKNKKINDERCSKKLLNIPDKYDTSSNFSKTTKNKYIKWEYLPERKFVGGQLVAVSTSRGKFITPPHEMIMHHATTTIGTANKLKQLKYVRDYKKKKKY